MWKPCDYFTETKAANNTNRNIFKKISGGKLLFIIPNVKRTFMLNRPKAFFSNECY